MGKQNLVIAAMAKEFSVLLEGTEQSNSTLPTTLQPDHLLLMSKQISDHADDWPATKLHRWIGSVQCGMVGNHMLAFDGARAMFKKISKALKEIDVDQDLIDLLDPDNAFTLDIGGES